MHNAHCGVPHSYPVYNFFQLPGPTCSYGTRSRTTSVCQCVVCVSYELHSARGWPMANAAYSIVPNWYTVEYRMHGPAQYRTLASLMNEALNENFKNRHTSMQSSIDPLAYEKLKVFRSELACVQPEEQCVQALQATIIGHTPHWATH